MLLKGSTWEEIAGRVLSVEIFYLFIFLMCAFLSLGWAGQRGRRLPSVGRALPDLTFY